MKRNIMPGTSKSGICPRRRRIVTIAHLGPTDYVGVIGYRFPDRYGGASPTGKVRFCNDAR